jgi:hypothetical protein
LQDRPDAHRIDADDLFAGAAPDVRQAGYMNDSLYPLAGVRHRCGIRDVTEMMRDRAARWAQVEA